MLGKFIYGKFSWKIILINCDCNFLIIVIFFALFTRTINSGNCPDAQLISPCTCNTTDVYCNGDGTIINIGKVFEAISYNYGPGQQQFSKFTFENTTNKLLPSDMFRGVLFSTIQFEHNPELTCAHPDAFGVIGSITTNFTSTSTSFSTM